MTELPDRRFWLAAAGWIAFALAAGLLLARPAVSPLSRYWFSWFAVAYMVLAAVARRYPRAAPAVPLVAMAAAVLVAVRYALVTIGADWFVDVYVLGSAVVIGLALFQLATRRMQPLVFAASVIGVALVTNWTFNAVSGAGVNPDLYPAHTMASPFRAELPILLLALAGVGLWLTRTPAQAARRLGLAWPTPMAVGLAVAAGMCLVASEPFVDYLSYLLTPEAFFGVEDVQAKVAATDTIPIVLTWALLAGVGEELLFRGALQPRSGLVVAALLFAMIHVQYGVTPILGWVFVAGIVFGLLRMLYDTTTAIIGHVSTGFFAIMSGFLRPPWSWVFLLLLLLLLLGWIWYSDRRVRSEEGPDPVRPT